MNPASRFYATFFEVPPGSDREHTCRHEPGGTVTFSDRDPYHYKLCDIEYTVRELPWEVRYVGDWGHPMGQRMLLFVQE